MHHSEFIIADLAFRGFARSRPDEQDFYEALGKAPVVRPALNYALAAVRAAVERLGEQARRPPIGTRAPSAR